MDLSKNLYKIARKLEAYCRKCPDYKGEGWCVYPHDPDVSVGEGTGWPKKPSPPATKERCEQLAQNLSSHGGSGGYKKKKKKKKKHSSII